ncbi:hypothetical protein K0M31_003303, partial [Melipona bicolor]
EDLVPKKSDLCSPTDVKNNILFDPTPISLIKNNRILEDKLRAKLILIPCLYYRKYENFIHIQTATLQSKLQRYLEAPVVLSKLPRIQPVYETSIYTKATRFIVKLSKWRGNLGTNRVPNGFSLTFSRTFAKTSPAQIGKKRCVPV